MIQHELFARPGDTLKVATGTDAEAVRRIMLQEPIPIAVVMEAPAMLDAIKNWVRHSHGQGLCEECYAIEDAMIAILQRLSTPRCAPVDDAKHEQRERDRSRAL